uniref:Pancreatic secretory granule membrane major glycoprotein GP2 n=1 Tax=Magallana gigas TaxID=29159 RepID=A0A8W8MTJ5_MAGGI
MSYVKTVYWSILLLTFYDVGAQLLHFCETNGKDPCEVANETVPFEPEARYVNCDQPSGTQYCDRYIVPGWYRYSERMWDQCPSLGKCGTVYPYWLNGPHPTEVNTEVQRSVCKVGFGGCCERQVTIKIRNCGQFMAYCLPALDSCPERYCFGESGPSTTKTSTHLLQTVKAATNDGPSSSTTVIVMGAVIGILLISIIVFGSVVVVRKRYRNKGTDGNTYEEPFTTLQENTYETSANVYTNEEGGYEQLPVDHNTKSGYSVQSDDPYDSIDDRIRSGLSREEEINLEEK